MGLPFQAIEQRGSTISDVYPDVKAIKEDRWPLGFADSAVRIYTARHARRSGGVPDDEAVPSV
jgi:hypothetical protein